MYGNNYNKTDDGRRYSHSSIGVDEGNREHISKEDLNFIIFNTILGLYKKLQPEIRHDITVAVECALETKHKDGVI